MNRKMGKNDKECSNFQQKLIESVMENVSVHDDSSLSLHLEGCTECRAFLKTLIRLERKISEDTKIYPKPHDSILRNIIRYMEIKNSGVRKNRKFWDVVFAVLQVRIPLYQAVGGVLVVIFLTGFLLTGNFLPGKSGLKINTDRFGSQAADLSDSLITGTTERGQNAREDSILVGFLQYSL